VNLWPEIADARGADLRAPWDVEGLMLTALPVHHPLLCFILCRSEPSTVFTIGGDEMAVPRPDRSGRLEPERNISDRQLSSLPGHDGLPPWSKST